MSDPTFDPVADLEARMRRDGLTLDPDDAAFLLEVVPIAREWSQVIRVAETRYGEPALIHPLKPASAT